MEEKADLDRVIDEERKRENETERIYQSDNGSELKNKVMKALIKVLGLKEVHSRAYNPRTNGKIENRIKEIAKKLQAELNGRNLADVSEEEIEQLLRSVLATMNFNPSSITSCRPYEVRMSSVICASGSSIRFVQRVFMCCLHHLPLLILPAPTPLLIRIAATGCPPRLVEAS